MQKRIVQNCHMLNEEHSVCKIGNIKVVYFSDSEDRTEIIAVHDVTLSKPQNYKPHFFSINTFNNRRSKEHHASVCSIKVVYFNFAGEEVTAIHCRSNKYNHVVDFKYFAKTHCPESQTINTG